MNKNIEEGNVLIEQLLSIAKIDDQVQVVVIPPFVCLSDVNNRTKGSRIKLGAQNCHQEKAGAFTGEISADMLKAVGCEYVLIGHSERRTYFAENSEILSAKVIAALNAGLKAIFCCGEQLEQRNANKHFETVADQLGAALFGFSKEAISNTIIAYEPVWAIGTGETANSEQIQAMHAHIRQLFARKYGLEIAENLSILYGGSCKASNAEEIFSNKDVDGGLIGGASLIAEDFNQIIIAARK